MYISTSLADVTSQNEAMTGYRYRDCASGEFGQIERFAAGTLTVYIGVVTGGTGMRLRASYVAKTDNSTVKHIVGGHSIPWQVQLRGTFSDGSTVYFCAGSLLSKEWVVTAAHCLPPEYQEKMKSGIEFSLSLGGQYLDGLASQLIPFGVEDIFINEQYDDQKSYNDIALIHLREAASASSSIQTIQWPSKSDLPIIAAGLTATVSGWGSAYLDRTVAGEPVRVDVPIVAESRCESFVGDLGGTYGDAVLCTDATGNGPCLGDSGGPLFVYYNRRYLLIGIVSYGFYHCWSDGSTATAVYARISAFTSWIQKTFDSLDKSGASAIPFTASSWLR